MTRRLDWGDPKSRSCVPHLRSRIRLAPTDAGIFPIAYLQHVREIQHPLRATSCI